MFMSVGDTGRGHGVKTGRRRARRGPGTGAAGDREEGMMSERIASCGSLHDSTNLLLQYCSTDDTMSASSNMDMEDRVSHLEQRLQLQEDEIQLLKAALADALRRLGYCEEQNQGVQTGGVQSGRRALAAAAPAPPIKVRQLLQALPSRPLNNGYAQQKRLLSSPSSPKKEVLQSIKRKSMSTERLTLVRREMAAESRSRTTPPAAPLLGKGKNGMGAFFVIAFYVSTRENLQSREVNRRLFRKQKDRKLITFTQKLVSKSVDLRGYSSFISTGGQCCLN
nr:echinoderm microtubule-associated protein-like 1 [Nothobranchius furzeri]